ncbi:MAG: hypothetical protein L0G99_17225 [Propionibacteriales bacterium]|nr:hypothetical protein [Propionibacteriales bacterium]
MPDRDLLLDALAARLTALPGIARLEPTLRDVVAATARATAQKVGLPPSDSVAGVMITASDAGTDVSVDISTTAPPTALETAQQARQAITEVLTAHGRHPGRIVVTVLGVEA